MQSLPDIRALPLPSSFTAALLKLVIRTLEIAESDETENLLVAVRLSSATIGTSPTFGQLAIPSISDWSEAIKTERMATPSVRVHELVDLLKMINPTTSVCDACGEFAINQIGGKFMALVPNELCPFCLTGHVKIEPMILRTVNWATGELVAPNDAYDSHSRVGLGIPLTDEAIVRWAGGINWDLDAALLEAKISIHGFLAYLHLKTDVLPEIEQAPQILLQPFAKHDESMHKCWLDGAARFLDEREITNLPHKKFLSDGRRRDEFTPITIGDRTYLIDGKIGEGDKCDVYRARWDHEPTERVIIKALVVPGDKDLFDREIAMLNGMRRYDDIDSEFFLRFIPKVSLAGHGRFPDGSVQPMVVLHDFHQFDWTLEDIRQKFPDGVHPRHVVWMMNRVTEFLSWLHAKRVVHGAILPQHLLVNVWTHRIKFLDWGYAVTMNSPLKGFVSNALAFYPNPLTHDWFMKVIGIKFQPQDDLAMACRCMLYTLGSDPLTGHGALTRCPEGNDVRPLIQMLYDHAAYDNSRPSAMSASAFKESFGKIAASIYGPPRFVPFEVPGE